MDKEEWTAQPQGQAILHQTKRRYGSKALVLAVLICVVLYQWQIHPVMHCRQQYLEYPGESIKWEPCGEIDGHSLECSAIDVPMDQFDEENSGNRTFNIPLLRMRGHNATKNLLLNPGGPGASGIGFIHRRGRQINAIVGEEFHLLSFDPRGVNSSRPAALCYPDEETRSELSPVHDREALADSAEIYAWTSNYVRACADLAGEHGKYLNTPQTAADMNSILDAVGQHGMVYWGFSYGSILGQTYAGLYPDRSERVIIDGVGDERLWYDVWGMDDYMANTEDVLYGFFDECIKAGADCSLSALANTTTELKDLVFNFTEKLKEQPISVYINNRTYGALDYKNLWYSGIFMALYKPTVWSELADQITKLIGGNATDAFLKYGLVESSVGVQDDSNPAIMLNDGLSGPEYWSQGRTALLEKLDPFFNSSIFAPFEAITFYQRQQWLVPRTHSYAPSAVVQTVHPLLILGTSHDPVSPLKSAKAARERFVGSRIVELEGYGHCSVAVASICAARHIREFLTDGKLPAEDRKCKVDGPYFTRPEDTVMESSWPGFDVEEQRIYEAQVALAKDQEWPRAY